MKLWRKNARALNEMANQKHQGRKNRWAMTLPPMLHTLGKLLMERAGVKC